jgi:hypothetical protein
MRSSLRALMQKPMMITQTPTTHRHRSKVTAAPIAAKISPV